MRVEHPIVSALSSMIRFTGGREILIAPLSIAVGYLLLCFDWGTNGGFLYFAVAVLGCICLALGLLTAAAYVKAHWINAVTADTRTFFAICAAPGAVAMWGILRIVWIGPLNVHIAGPLFFRDWFVSANPDLAIFIGLACLGALVGERRHGRQGRARGAFWGTAAALVVVTNAYFLGVTDFSVFMTPDSPSYLYRNSCRPIGYLILLTMFKATDARLLVAFQLNAVLLSQVAVAYAVSRLTRSTLAAIATLLIATLFCHLYALAFDVMTEAVFAAAFGFIVAGAIAYVASPTLRPALVIGLASAAAIAIKASAPPLIIATAALLLRPAPNRRQMAMAMLAPPLVCLLALMLWGRTSNGAWSPTNFSGYALAENVAWGIKKDQFSSDPALSGAVEDKLKGFDAVWPSPWNASSYLVHSMDNLDAMFWKGIFPIALDIYAPPQGSPSCAPIVNDALMKLGTEAIRRDPIRYAVHVAVQFYGLWAFALVPQKWSDHPAKKLDGIAEPTSDREWRAAPALWKPSPDRQAAIDRGASNYDGRVLFLDRVKTLAAMIGTPFGATPADFLRLEPQDTSAEPKPKSPTKHIYMWQYFAGAFSIVVIAISALVFRMPRLPPETAALVAIALLMNAYFGTQALFMFATPRYSACVEIGLAGFLAILACVAANFAIGTLGPKLKLLTNRVL